MILVRIPRSGITRLSRFCLKRFNDSDELLRRWRHNDPLDIYRREIKIL